MKMFDSDDYEEQDGMEQTAVKSVFLSVPI